MNASKAVVITATLAALALFTAPAPGAQSGKKKSQSSKTSEKTPATEGNDQEQSEAGQPGAESLRIEPWDPSHPRPIPPRGRFWVSVETDRSTYYIDDSVRVSFSASDDAYVYIFNTDAQGVTRQIFPNYFDSNSFIHAGRRYSIPRGGYSLIANGPPGPESLRIVAYRQRWHALDPWNRFRSSEPFPERGMGPDQMRSQIEREAEASGPGESPSREKAPESLGIRPVPYPPVRDYAENWAYFRTLPRHGYYPYPPVPYPPEPYPPEPYPYVPPSPAPPYNPAPYAPGAHDTGSIRISTAPTDCDVFINGIYVGRSPGLFPAPEGRCEVVIARLGYATERTEVRVSANHTQSLSVRLERE